MKKLFLFILLLFLLQAGILKAGNTGKIAGRVLDKNTGEPLIGANVIIKGTYLGASTDEDGSYFILQVPPGTYNLEFSYIGYRKVTIQNVKITADLTAQVSVKMQMEAVESDEVVVVAERKLVQHDVTSTLTSTTREEMQDTPGMESTLDMFKMQGGAVLNVVPKPVTLSSGVKLQVRDESIRDVHIRGGRGGEILYMVDGVPVTHPLYGGRSVLDLNVTDVDEIELLTGGFNAEYGQAQSGVINITTRSGKDYYEGGIEYKTDYWHPFGNTYDTQYATWYLSGPEFINKYILSKIGLKLPGRLHFFFSGNGTLTNTEYNNHRTRERLEFLTFKFNEKQDNNANLNLKFDWVISPMVKFALSYHGTWQKWSRFDWLWKNNPDNTVDYKRKNNHFSLTFNHTLSKSTFYNINIGYLDVSYQASRNGATPGDFWTFYADSLDTLGMVYNSWERLNPGRKPLEVKSNIKVPVTDETTGFFTSDGFENYWRDDFTKTYSFRGNITSQITKSHLIKGGLELQYHDLQYIDIQDGGVTLSNYGYSKYENGTEESLPPGPFPEFGQNRWVFYTKPIIGGFYIQDKFEHESLIINAGIRVDMLRHGDDIFNEEYKNQWEQSTGLKSDWRRYTIQTSPRFGISYPISDRMVMFFSYGHFTQLPELQFMYRDPWSIDLIGNPHLGYEQSVLYEFGFTKQFAYNWAIDIKSYTKDISKQIGTTLVGKAGEKTVSLYDNTGYARARGFEIKLKKRPSGYTNGELTYTIQWANGYSSSAFDDYIRSQTNFPRPIRERRLAWDVRHQLIFHGGLIIPDKKHPRLFGFKIPSNWSATLLAGFYSGYPYTPGTWNEVELQTKENIASGPWSFTTDLKIQKWVAIWNQFKLSFYLDIFNLFNINNVNVSYGFNTWTGKPYVYGDTIGDTKQIYKYYDMYRIMDPRQFTTDRYTKLGMKIEF